MRNSHCHWSYPTEVFLSISPVPSAGPTSVRESAVNTSSITVQWGAVDCIHHNGDITGYSVQYGVQGSGSTQTMNVSGGSVTEATISSLMPSTTYSIQVAAVNSAGIGDYSDAITTKTLQSNLLYGVYVYDSFLKKKTFFISYYRHVFCVLRKKHL